MKSEMRNKRAPNITKPLSNSLLKGEEQEKNLRILVPKVPQSKRA
jgi:hypothetical protein